MYWEKIEGFFTFKNYYDDIITNIIDNGIFVEIGAWKGKSIMFAAERTKELNKNIKLYTIDIFKVSDQCTSNLLPMNVEFYDQYLKNIEPMKDYINTIKMNSHDAYTLFDDNSIDFLFMDGEHSYEAVRKDLKLWYPKIKNSGIIAGHDYEWIDGRVKTAVCSFFLFTGVYNIHSQDVWYKIKNK
jgi:hypothetical protein